MRVDVSLAEAMLNATRQQIDAGNGRGKLLIYGNTMPANLGDAPGATPLVTIELAKPCGTVANGGLPLAQYNSAGDMIQANGQAQWARLVGGDGKVLADGTLSDQSGSGDFRIAGTNGTQLYQGGYLLLQTVLV